MALHAISLFSGAGGLDLALAGIARTVCYVEREAYAAAVLVARMQDGELDLAPVWDSVVTFDGRPWRGFVSLVHGGFPCQDISNAGKRAGIIDGERSGLWTEFARIIREVGPEYVFVENVSALVVRGLDVVLSDIHALGFDAEWGTFRASDVGAPHKRERVFILAHSRGIDGRGGAAWVGRGRGRAGDAGEAPGMGNPCRERLAFRVEPSDGGGTVRVEGPATFPPGPDDGVGWGRYLRASPGTEPTVRRGTHGLASRVDRLRLCGNGVVPQQARLAWEVLMRRMTAPARGGEGC